jgi:paraquat-inducible protein A
VKCRQCGHKNYTPASPKLTLAFALTALIFYIPANIFPFMTIEMYGKSNSSNIWNGVIQLADGGSFAIAAIVFLASIVIPFVKLIILFYLSLSAGNNKNPQMKSRLYFMVEAIGRWSMLDIYLLAVLVAILKLDHWTHVTPEIGSVLFAGVVIFTMLSSAFFNPLLISNEEKYES